MPPVPLTLALDQGGHSSRAILYDAEGQRLAQAQVPVDVRLEGQFRVEQDADELARSLAQAIEGLVRSEPGSVSAIAVAGLATQRASIVCWDRITGTALSPVLSWQDRRGIDHVSSLARKAAEIERRTGLVLSPHYGASKLRWCIEHLEAVRHAGAEHRVCCGPIASFLVHRLSQERPCVIDPANAGRTQLYNPASGDWDPWLLDQFQVPRNVLPRLVPTLGDFGRLTVAGRTVHLRCVTGDQSAALFGFGEPAPDTVYCNLGTGAFIQALLPEKVEVPQGLLRSIVFDDGDRRLQVMEGTVNGAGAALDWAGQALGVTRPDEALGQALRRADTAALFLNGVGGLGAPFWRADFPSRFLGDGDVEGKLAAVGESIVFLIAVIIERMLVAIPAPRRLIVTGGLSALDPVCQRLADITTLPVERPVEHEATARGVAYLAAGGPAGWRARSGSSCFQPQSDTSMMARYRSWRAAMAEALGSPV